MLGTRFLSLYHITNAILASSYLFIREWYPRSTVRGPSQLMGSMGVTMEAEIALAALVYIAARVRQYASWEEFLDRLFFLAKAVSLLLLYMTDSTAALRWGIVAGLHFFMVRRPAFDGASEVEFLVPTALARQVFQAPAEETWLVLYSAAWSEASEYVFPIFADLSVQYTSDRLRFATVEAGRWPEAAEMAEVDDSVGSGQVPSIILYQDGKEVKRLPPKGADGKVKPVKMDRGTLKRYFDLDRLKFEESKVK